MAGSAGHPRSLLHPGVLSCISHGSGTFTPFTYPFLPFLSTSSTCLGCVHPGIPCTGFTMVNFLTDASAMVSVWQQFAAATDAVSSVPLQAQASLPSQLCSERAGVSLPISSGELRAGYFQCAEHIFVQLCMPSLPQNHTLLSLLAGYLGDGEIR